MNSQPRAMRIPSLQTLRAFDAAGRHQSYSRAGEELGLTHSAVSHRIRDLEALTGERLFERRGNRMVPTAEGKRLLAQVRNALGLLEATFAPEAASQRVTVSVFPAFGARWLVPRLGAFRALHPDIDLALDLSSGIVALGDGIDAAIRYGDGHWPPHVSTRVADEILFPVCTPQFVAEAGLEGPSDLLRCPLLRHPWHSWAAWFEAAGVSGGEPRSGPEYSDSSLLLEAAQAGEGVALARRLGVVDALRSGALVRPFEAVAADFRAYHFVRPAGSRDERLDRFQHWLSAALADDVAALNAGIGLPGPR